MHPTAGRTRPVPVLAFIWAVTIFGTGLSVGLTTAHGIDVTERADGLAAFLLDRANANYFYIFEERIADNDLFQTYFPTTHRLAASNNLQALIAGTDLWERSITSDVHTVLRSALREYLEALIATLATYTSSVGGRERVLTLIRETTVAIDGNVYPIDRIDLSAPSHVREVIGSFSDPYLTLTDALGRLEETALPADLSTFDLDAYRRTIEAIITALERALEGYRTFFAGLERHGTRVSPQSLLEEYAVIRTTLETEVARFRRFIESYQTLQLDDFSTLSYTARVVAILQFIEDTAANRLEPEDLTENGQFVQFRGYALVFAQLADAQSPEHVQLILTRATLPPVSFRLKRDDRLHVLFGSYLGYALEWGPANALHAVATVELSHGIGDLFSVALFVSPLDLSLPVNRRIWEETDELNVEDIFTLSYGISVGFERLPLAVGISSRYRRGSPPWETGRIFFAVDMPLVTVF